MKKLAIVLVLALCCACLFATELTDKKNRVVTIGTIDPSIYGQPVYITSLGQSTEAAMVETVAKKIKLNYKYSATASADQVAASGAKTLILAVGKSGKGLGAAGISIEDEFARAKAILEVAKKNNMVVICAHLGGGTRRLGDSDKLLEMVLPQSSYLVVVEDGNFDDMLSNYAQANNKPITLIQGTKDCVDVFNAIFN